MTPQDIESFARQLAQQDTPDRQLKQLFDLAYCEERSKVIYEEMKRRRVVSVTKLIKAAIRAKL